MYRQQYYRWRRRLPALERTYEDAWLNIAWKCMLYDIRKQYESIQKCSFVSDDEADKVFNLILSEKSSLFNHLSKD
jgi:hypothetical protein